MKRLADKKKPSRLKKALKVAAVVGSFATPVAYVGDRVLPQMRHPSTMLNPPARSMQIDQRYVIPWHTKPEHMIQVSEREMRALARRGFRVPSQREEAQLRIELEIASGIRSGRPDWEYIMRFVHPGSYSTAEWAFSKMHWRLERTIQQLEGKLRSGDFKPENRAVIEKRISELKQLMDSGEFTKDMRRWLVEAGVSVARNREYPDIPNRAFLDESDVILHFY